MENNNTNNRENNNEYLSHTMQDFAHLYALMGISRSWIRYFDDLMNKTGDCESELAQKVAVRTAAKFCISMIKELLNAINGSKNGKIKACFVADLEKRIVELGCLQREVLVEDIDNGGNK